MDGWWMDVKIEGLEKEGHSVKMQRSQSSVLLVRGLKWGAGAGGRENMWWQWDGVKNIVTKTIYSRVTGLRSSFMEQSGLMYYISWRHGCQIGRKKVNELNKKSRKTSQVTVTLVLNKNSSKNRSKIPQILTAIMSSVKQSSKYQQTDRSSELLFVNASGELVLAPPTAVKPRPGFEPQSSNYCPDTWTTRPWATKASPHFSFGPSVTVQGYWPQVWMSVLGGAPGPPWP